MSVILRPYRSRSAPKVLFESSSPATGLTALMVAFALGVVVLLTAVIPSQAQGPDAAPPVMAADGN